MSDVLRRAAALASEAALRSELAVIGDTEAATRVRRAAEAAHGRAEAALGAAALAIAWGVYGRNCAEVERFVHACVGCAAPNTYGVALLDSGGLCACVTAAASIASMLPLTHRASASLPLPEDAADRRYWPRTHALFQLLTTRVPSSRWYVKLDTDTFFNVRELRAALFGSGGGQPLAPAMVGRRRMNSSAALGSGGGGSLPGSATSDYLGKEMRLFAYKGQRLTYMQGGAYVLSRRAALAAAACELGAWRRCPNRVFEDLSNPRTNLIMRNSCWVPQTIAEDLYVGVCMHEARLAATAQPCMLSLRAATTHAATPGGVNATASNAAGVAIRPSVRAAAATERLEARAEAKAEADTRSRFVRSRGRCLCPITAHPLKSASMLEWVRNRSRARGCLD